MTVMDVCAVLDAADQKTNASQVRTGKVLINFDERVVSVDDLPVHLTGREYGILELLGRHQGTTLTKEMLLDHLYGGTDEPNFRIIDVFVCKLRKKLAQATGGNHYIETVWGRGYVFRDLTCHLVADSPGRQIPATEVVQLQSPSAG
jgi:two-component system cell cycle response regulator CtrA